MSDGYPFFQDQQTTGQNGKKSKKLRLVTSNRKIETFYH